MAADLLKDISNKQNLINFQYSLNNSNKIDLNLHKITEELIQNNFSEQSLIDLQHPVSDNITMDQYLPNSGLASFFRILNLSLSIPCIYFHFLILRMVSREKKKVGETLHGKALVIYAPFVVFVHLMVTTNINGIMSYTYPASEHLGSWYCYIVGIVFHGMGAYVGSFSLLIAAMKYWFVVHNAKANNLGIERSQTVFIIIHLVFTTIWPLLNAVSTGDVDRGFWINQCWGYGARDSEIEKNFWNAVGEAFCYFRLYQIDYYIGKRASEILEPCLRALCGGMTFSFMLFQSNIIELIIYWKLFKHIDRLHEQCEDNIPNAQSQQAKMRRKRRHRINKVLQILGYVTESSGNVVLAIGWFLLKSNSSLQLVLASCFLFIFAIPSPLSHLMAESRVKDTVVNSGWVEGFKSMFHSPAKIRRLEQEKVAKALAAEKESDQNNKPQRNPESKLSTRRQPIRRTNNNLRAEPAGNDDVTLQRADDHCSNNRIEIATKQIQQRSLASNVMEQDKVVVEDIESQAVDIISPTSKHQLECVDELSQTQRDQLRHKNEKKHFNLSNTETNGNSTLAAWNENFKDNEEFNAFSKKYVLQHMLWTLNSGKGEIVYLNYLNLLRYIEQYFSELSHDTINDDLMVALINAWAVFQKSGKSSNRNTYLNHIKISNDKRSLKSIEEKETPEKLTRTRIIQLLLTSDSNQTQYRKYLKELNDVERSLEKNYIPECWS